METTEEQTCCTCKWFMGHRDPDYSIVVSHTCTNPNSFSCTRGNSYWELKDPEEERIIEKGW